jgi:membrane-bound lytic murein transglycosylase F
MIRSRFIRFFLALFALSQCRQNGETQAFLSQPAVETDLAEIKKRGYLEAILDNNSISCFIYKGKPWGRVRKASKFPNNVICF